MNKKPIEITLHRERLTMHDVVFHSKSELGEAILYLDHELVRRLGYSVTYHSHPATGR